MRKPTDKGGVERAIRYLKMRFFPARVIPSLESGNVGILHFLETVAMQRGHPTQKDRTGGEVFAEEKARLLPLPSAAIRNELVTSVPADSPAFAFLNANPTRSLLRPRTAAAGRDRRRGAFARRRPHRRAVGQHARSWVKGQVIKAPEHRAAALCCRSSSGPTSSIVTSSPMISEAMMTTENDPAEALRTGILRPPRKLSVRSSRTL